MTQNNATDIHFHFRYTPKLAVLALQQHYYNHRQKTWLPLIAMIVGLFSLLRTGGDMSMALFVAILSYSILFFLEFMFLKLYYPWMAKRQFSKTPLYHQDMYFTITADGLHIKTEKSQNTILFQDVIKWVQTPDFSMLYKTPQLYCILPHHVTDIATIYALYQQAQDKPKTVTHTLICKTGTYRLTPADIITASQLHIRKDAKYVLRHHCMLAALPAVVTTFTRSFNLAQASMVFITFFVILKAVDYFFAHIVVPQLAKRKFAKSPYLHHDFGIDFDPIKNEIYTYSLTGKTKLTGKEIIKVKKSQTHYLLYLQPRVYIILPIAQLHKQNFDFSRFDATLDHMDIEIEDR